MMKLFSLLLFVLNLTVSNSLSCDLLGRGGCIDSCQAQNCSSGYCVGKNGSSGVCKCIRCANDHHGNAL